MPPNSHQSNQPAHHAVPTGTKRRKHIDWAGRTVRIELFIVIVGSALLIAATALYLGLSGGLNYESKRVKKDNYQAVFINAAPKTGGYDGSLYFGRINAINDKYLVLNDVYFLNEQQGENSQTNLQLAKLGCQQAHSPFDEMVINRSQVAFWENLRNDGQVAKAIAEFKKQNPKGPDCTRQTTQPQPAAAQTTP